MTHARTRQPSGERETSPWLTIFFGSPRPSASRRRVAVDHASEPVLLGARADREPRLARGDLPAAAAEFVAAAQVLVYAGAVVVMFLFVIAYLGDRSARSRGPAARAGRRSAPSLAAGALLIEIVVAIALAAGSSLGHDSAVSAAFGSPACDRARSSSPTTSLAFEITSIVLLVAAVGGVVLGAHARAAPQPKEARVMQRARDVSLVPRPRGVPVRARARSACSSGGTR